MATGVRILQVYSVQESFGCLNSFIGKNPINPMVNASWRKQSDQCVKLPNLHTTDKNPVL